MAWWKVGKHVAMDARAVYLSMWESNGPICDGGKEEVGLVCPTKFRPILGMRQWVLLRR